MSLDEPTQEVNPFDAPVMPPVMHPVVPQEEQASESLGFGFWLPIAMCFAISLPLIYPPFIGVYGAVATGYAMGRGLILQSRYRRARKLSIPYKFEGGFILFLKSIALGVIALIACCITFVATCVPAGIMVHNWRAWMRVFVIVSGLLGIFVGYLLIRLTVPKVPKS